MRLISFIIFLALLFVFSLVPFDADAGKWKTEYFSSPQSYQVIQGVNYRVAPDKNSQKYGTLKKGQTVLVSGIVKGWYQIVLQNGGSAYAWNAYLSPASGENTVRKTTKKTSRKSYVNKNHSRCRNMSKGVYGWLHENAEILEDQTFSVNFPSVGNEGCFQTLVEPDASETHFLLTNSSGDIKYQFKSVDPLEIGCNVVAVGFRDFNKDERPEIIVIADCLASRGKRYNENFVYWSTGNAGWMLDERTNSEICDYETYSEVKKRLKKIKPPN